MTSNKYKEQAALIKDLLEAQARKSEADYQYQQALSSYWGALADLRRAMGRRIMMKNTLAIILAAALFMIGCHSNKPLEQPPQGVHVQLIQAAPALATDCVSRRW